MYQNPEGLRLNATKSGAAPALRANFAIIIACVVWFVCQNCLMCSIFDGAMLFVVVLF